MSSTSQLPATTTTKATKINPQNSLSNLPTLPCDGLSNFFHLSASPNNNSKYLYYVNAQATSKPLSSTTIIPLSQASRHARARLNTVPWYKRTRSPIDDKSNLSKASKMSRDRLLPLDKLFHNPTHTTTDDDQPSPTNDLTPLDGSMKFNENNLRQMKENGHLRNSSHLATR